MSDITCFESWTVSAWYLFWHLTIYFLDNNIFSWFRIPYFSYLSLKIEISNIAKYIEPSISRPHYLFVFWINFQMWVMLCMSLIYYFLCFPYFRYNISIFNSWIIILMIYFLISFLFYFWYFLLLIPIPIFIKLYTFFILI